MVDKSKLLEWAKDITYTRVSGSNGKIEPSEIPNIAKYLESVYTTLVKLNSDE